MGAKSSLDFGNLFELFRRELGAKRIDCLEQGLRALGPGDGVIGKTLGKREWLLFAFARLGKLRPLHHDEQGVGEVAPGVELICSNADCGLHGAQFHRKAPWTVPPMPARSVAVTGVMRLASCIFPVPPMPARPGAVTRVMRLASWIFPVVLWSRPARGCAPGRGQKDQG